MYEVVCAGCRRLIRQQDSQGESGIYSPNRAFILCEPCFLEEDRLIGEQGNTMPEVLERYKSNLKLGRLYV